MQFGLLPRFAGRGLGGALLVSGDGAGLGMGERRERRRGRAGYAGCGCTPAPWIALGPGQLPGRGFRVYRSETRPRTFPETTPGPWPGAKGPPPR